VKLLQNLAGYPEAGKPLAIARHGETLGFYIPTQKKSRKAEVDAMRAAAKELDAMIAAWGASEVDGMPSKPLVLGCQHSDSCSTRAARSPHHRVAFSPPHWRSVSDLDGRH
jgi:hypothetical protein